MKTTFFEPRGRERTQLLSWVLLVGAALALLLIDCRVVAQESRPEARPTSNTIESGKFRFYETRQPLGEETYEIKRRLDGSLETTAKMDLPFMGEDEKPKLRASLVSASDLTPVSFQIEGTRPLGVPIKTSVAIRDRVATINSANHGGGSSAARQLKVPKNFFTFGGYVPVTLEMMLVRYWLRHGRPARLALVPNGEALIEYRGRDFATVAGRRVALQRYHLSGRNWGGGWGRQTLWFDSNGGLIAAVNLATDVETNLTAIRDGYDAALSFFLKRAVEDGIERFTRIADRLSPKTNRPLVLLGGTIIDVTGKPPVENSAVFIQGDRIVAVTSRTKFRIPAGAVIKDVSGKYLVPGLWDSHAHMYQVELGPAYLAAGITTARDVGNEIEYATTMRDAAKQGRGLGPRLLLAGYINGRNDFHAFDVQVGTPAEARAAVQRYKAAGFDQIKIRDHVKPDILKMITAEAHRLGMTVTGHVPEGMNAIQAVEAGMDQLDHLNYVESAFSPELRRGQPLFEIELNSPASKKALEFFKQHGTVIHPTNAVLELMIRPMNMPIESFEPGLTQVAPELFEQINRKGVEVESAEVVEAVRAAVATLLKITMALHQAGIPIIAGSDVGVPGHTLHRELELYVKAGLTPLEALQTATLTPARVMKLENEVGTIEAGKRADIIILDGNPLENISNIRKLRFVVAQGRLFDTSKLKETIGFKL